jgi:hypothetical protein
MPDSIHTEFKGIRAERLAAMQSTPGTSASVRTAHDPTLQNGQLIEVVVTKLTRKEVFFESNTLVLKSDNPGNLKLGEHLLFRVLDASTSPPKLRLISEGALPNSSLAGFSTYLRSLLFRANPYSQPAQHINALLSVISQGAQTVSPEMAKNLSAWLNVPSVVNGNWVKDKLKKSGIFFDSTAGVGKDSSDLKEILLALRSSASDIGLPSGHSVTTLLDGITSAQVKALDSLLSGAINYSFLMPFFPGGLFQVGVYQAEEQRFRNQWHVHLDHQSDEMGVLQIDVLMERNAVSVHFSSDQPWVTSLLRDNQSRLIEAINQHGLTVRSVGVSSMASATLDPYLAKESHAILDLKV